VEDGAVAEKVSRNYRDLVAWQRAMDLVEAVYAVTREFPGDERFALTSQLRRAAVSIPSNIAEGEGRRSRNEFGHFLAVAYGSLREVETQLLIAIRLNYVSEEKCQPAFDLTDEIGRIISGLSRSLDRPR
jgi:four helix bundle protein